MTDRGPTIFAFPAGSLPSLQLLPNRMSKSMISLEFLAQGSREKNFQFFSRVFPVRQGTEEAELPPSAQCRGGVAAVSAAKA